MVEFQNLSQALDHTMGRVEGAKEDVTVGDYLDVIDSSWAIGRLFTQLKLYFSGKGWVNEDVAKGMIKGFDRETLAEIQKICSDILLKLQHPEQTYRNEVEDPMMDIKGFEDIQPSTKDFHKAAKEAAPLGGHHIDHSISSLIKEIGLLQDWVQDEQIDRYKSVSETLGDWGPETFDQIEQDPALKKYFEKFVKLTYDHRFQSENFSGPTKEAILMIGSIFNKELFPDGVPNYENIRNEEKLQFRLKMKTLMPAFNSWLTRNIVNGEFKQEELRELFGSPKEEAESGLFRLNPDNKSGLKNLRDEVAKFSVTDFNESFIDKNDNAKELFFKEFFIPLLFEYRAPEETRLAHSYQLLKDLHDDQTPFEDTEGFAVARSEIRALVATGAVKLSDLPPKTLEEFQALEKKGNRWLNFGVDMTSGLRAFAKAKRLINKIHIQHPDYPLDLPQNPLIEQARNQINRLVDERHIPASENIDDYSIKTLNSLIREKLGEEPVLIDAFQEFIPIYLDRQSQTMDNLEEKIVPDEYLGTEQ